MRITVKYLLGISTIIAGRFLIDCDIRWLQPFGTTIIFMGGMCWQYLDSKAKGGKNGLM